MTAMIASMLRDDTTTAGVPVEALGGLLDDLALVLLGVDRDLYTARPESGVSGSVGGHVRHVLDHVAAFVEAGPLVLTYDDRRRGTAVEGDPDEALSQIYWLQGGLERMARRPHDEHVRVRSQIATNGQAITTWSTLGRELVFVMNHTLHHQAIIALLLAARGVTALPERFGHAPSTPIPS